MKLSEAFKILFATISYQLGVADAESMVDVKKAVGQGCKNSIQFTSSFITAKGSKCSTCQFCQGSTLNSMFDPKAVDACTECTASDDACDTLEVVTSFEDPWPMDFIKLQASAKTSETDPGKITMMGSNDSKVWDVLYDSIFTFDDRKGYKTLSLNNDKAYNQYSIKFQKKNKTSKMHIGEYGLVQAYTRHCTSKIHNDLTGDYIFPFETTAPTDAPTDAPTADPTNLPTNSPTPPPTYLTTSFKPAVIHVKNQSRVGTIQNPAREWIISFGVSFSNMEDLTKHTGVVRFGTKDCVQGGPGCREPAFMTGGMWVEGGNGMFLISGTSKNPNQNCHGGKFELDKTYKIKGVAIGSDVKLFIDDKIICSFPQDKSIRTSQPLKVDAWITHSDAGGWGGQAASSAVVTNLQYARVS